MFFLVDFGIFFWSKGWVVFEVVCFLFGLIYLDVVPCVVLGLISFFGFDHFFGWVRVCLFAVLVDLLFHWFDAIVLL